MNKPHEVSLHVYNGKYVAQIMLSVIRTWFSKASVYIAMKR